MRVISTIIFSLVCFVGVAQSSTDSVVIVGNCWGGGIKKATNIDSAVKKMNSSSIEPASPEYLVVLDGVPVPHNTLAYLDTNDVADIVIIKPRPAAATISWCDGSLNGLILIKTKHISAGTIIIRDFVSNAVIPLATVSLESIDKKHKLILLANDSGIIRTDQLRSSTNYKMTVSATGYQTHSAILTPTRVFSCNVLLTRNDANPPGKMDNKSYPTVITIESPINSLSVYPNPVARGNRFTIEMSKENTNNKIIRLINTNGKEMIRQPINGLSKFTIATNTNWTAGIYFLEVRLDDGERIGLTKMLIQ